MEYRLFKGFFVVLLCFVCACKVKSENAVSDPRKVDPVLVNLLTTRANTLLQGHLAGVKQTPTRVHLVLEDKRGWSAGSSTASSIHTALKFAVRQLLMEQQRHKMQVNL